jgi:hypothetical protein
MKRYPDKSHQRRKEREAAEKAAAADRLRNLEEALKRQQDQLDRLSQQGISGQSHRHMLEAASYELKGDGGGRHGRTNCA